MATNRLNGSGALNYMGVNAPQPPNLITMDRRPTVTDGVGMPLGTIWLIPQEDITGVITPQQEVWMLVGNQRGINVWKHLRGSAGPPSNPFGINVITYSTHGTYTYTPTPGMINVTVECVGGGGGSSSYKDISTPPSQANAFVLPGGGGGGYCQKTFIASAIGSSQTVVVGAGGIAGATPTNPGSLTLGTAGGSTTFLTLTAHGGAADTTGVSPQIIAGGSATGGDINLSGQSTMLSYAVVNFVVDAQPFLFVAPTSGIGGNSPKGFGFGGNAPIDYLHNASQGTGYGAGGSGIAYESLGDGHVNLGAAGTGGLVIITEYF